MNPYTTSIRIFLLLLLSFSTGSLYAQLGNVDASSFEVEFKEVEVEFKKNEIVSNPARIKNTSDQEVVFYMEASLPPGWSGLGFSKRLYKVAPGDSMYIPFRIVPKGQLIGNTKYSINVMVRTEDGLPIGVSSFFCFTKKIVKWEMSVLPEDKIYFRNGESQSDFSLALLNTGNYEQDFQLSLNGGQRDDMVLLDEDDNVIESPSYTVGLNSGEDTTLNFKVKPAGFNRNHRTVSLVNHRPLSELEEQRFRFYAVSEEAKQVGEDHRKKATKVDFVKLANEKEVSPYSTENIPLIAEAQIQNILSDFSFMSLNLRGLKQIDENRRLMYFTQFYYAENYFNENPFENLPWYVGYFDKKWDVQVGLVNGRSLGVLASGKGITGSYQVAPSHRVGAHFTQTPGFQNTRSTSFGVYHEYMGTGRIRVSSTLARSQDDRQKLNSNVASSRINARIAQGHNLSLLLAGSLREYTDTNVTQLGYMVSATYSAILLDKKLRTVLNGRYNAPTFGVSTTERTSASNRSTYDFNPKLQLQLLNNINVINRYFGRFNDSIQYSFRNIFNRLNMAVRTDIGTFQPGIFYDITEQALFTLHFRGVSFTYNNFNFERNTLFTTTLRAGYNNALEYPEIREYFTAQWSMLARVKTLTMNLRYFYGPSNPVLLANSLSQNTYPQQFRGSLQHQYMFNNTRFILQSGLNYSYNNQINSHTLTLFPEVFYFTTTGWRFSVNANYTFGSSNFQSATQNLNGIRGIEDPDPSATITNTFRVGASIRKEFGIPIPFSKAKNYDLAFTAFYDLNGNGVHDRSEPTIENVVVRLDENEVITNSNGRAGLKNMPKGNYAFVIIPLDAPDGWFAETPDSIFVNTSKPVSIPFVRGVKLFGSVVMDRDQLVTEDDKQFDLSNIKITATSDGKAYSALTGFNGDFEMYLPNGTYVISFDENVLTERFRIMQNNIPVTLDKDLENIQVTFFIVEKRRKVNIKRFGTED